MGFFSIFKKEEAKVGCLSKLDLSKASNELSPERKKHLNDVLTKGGVEELNKRKKEIAIEQNKKTQLIINNFEDILNVLKNDEKTLVLQETKKNFPLFFSKFLGPKKFKDKVDLEQYVQEEVLCFLNSEHVSLATRISFLRKRGYSVSYINLKVMYIASKLRLFKEEMHMKNLMLLIENFNFADNELKKIESNLK